jgi:hypothetical protein
MPDYKNGKIYTIRCKDDPALIYVGCTVQTLSQRWTDHKKRAKQDEYKHIKLYKTMIEFGIPKFYIELYKNVDCENKEQLLAEEGKFIREIGTLNEHIAGRKKTEWLNDNKEYIKKYRVERYKQN